MMKWAREHPNWTWVFGLVLWFFAHYPLGLIYGLTLGILVPDNAETIIENTEWIFWITWLAGVFAVTLWMLKAKRRDFSYAFLVIVPFGWIWLLLLKPRKEILDVINGELVTRMWIADDKEKREAR